MLTQERLTQLLEYDAQTGGFTWKRNRKEAGCKRHDGYVLISVDRKLYLRHRLVWLWMTGKFPAVGIDHINCVKGDDRWENLRQASMSANLANTKRPKTNKSGFKGVHWHPQSQKWRVQIGFGRNREHIGLFKSVEIAAEAYRKAAERKYGDFARFN